MVKLESSFLIYSVELLRLFVKPKLWRWAPILQYQALGACFKPYNAFFRSYTLSSLPLIEKPSGCSIKISSHGRHLGKMNSHQAGVYSFQLEMLNLTTFLSYPNRW